MLRVHCICGHKYQANCGLLLDRIGRENSHAHTTFAIDPAYLHTKLKTIGAVFHICQFDHIHRVGFDSVLCIR